MDKNIEKNIETFIEKTMFLQDIPGLAIAITKENEIVYSKGFGLRNIDSKENVNQETIFHMASITKTFVGTGIMQLVEQGKIDMNKPVVDYLPYFHLKDSRYKDITVLHMLSHTSGMPDCADYGWENPEYDDQALERYVRSLDNISLIGEPGERFRYSNIAYEVLGDLIAEVSGESFEDYIEKNIFKPLGMNDSMLISKDRRTETLASPHIKNEDRKVVVSKVFPYNRAHGPSSTLTSNVLDISRWAMMNLGRGELEGVRILKDATYDLLWNPVATIKSNKEDIGISWFLSKHRGYTVIGHEGSDIGFRTSLGLIPKESLSVSVLANISSASTKKIMKAIFDSILGYESHQ